MLVRILTILTALALALAFVGDLGADAGARISTRPSVAAKASRADGPDRVDGTIYSQRDNDNGVAIVSQHFEARLVRFDSQGADNFKIKSRATVKQVRVDGLYFNGVGPAKSVHVTFYKNAGGLPGAVVKDVPSATFIDTTGTGTFDIKIPKTVLKGGSYWLSVYANLGFRIGGDWGWLTNLRVRGFGSMWRNPGDGFSTGCTAWATTTTCVLAGEGGDFSFALVGKGH